MFNILAAIFGGCLTTVIFIAVEVALIAKAVIDSGNGRWLWLALFFLGWVAMVTTIKGQVWPRLKTWLIKVIEEGGTGFPNPIEPYCRFMDWWRLRRPYPIRLAYEEGWEFTVVSHPIAAWEKALTAFKDLLIPPKKKEGEKPRRATSPMMNGLILVSFIWLALVIANPASAWPITGWMAIFCLLINAFFPSIYFLFVYAQNEWKYRRRVIIVTNLRVKFLDMTELGAWTERDVPLGKLLEAITSSSAGQELIANKTLQAKGPVGQLVDALLGGGAHIGDLDLGTAIARGSMDYVPHLPWVVATLQAILEHTKLIGNLSPGRSLGIALVDPVKEKAVQDEGGDSWKDGRKIIDLYGQRLLAWFGLPQEGLTILSTSPKDGSKMVNLWDMVRGQPNPRRWDVQTATRLYASVADEEAVEYVDIR